MKIRDIIKETATSGATGAGSVASSATGFVNGGIGSTFRASKKKKPKLIKR